MMPSQFSCAMCSVTFSTNADQRTHMQSAWHIWNLKRRMASLSALSHQVFEDQVVSIQPAGSSAAYQETTFEIENREEDEDSDASTLILSSSSNADEFDDNISESEFDSTACIFCPLTSQTTNANIGHMKTAHGLFIPDCESLIDVPSFLSYLSLIVNDFYECLYCGKQKISAEGVRAHMLSKGHCKLSPEELSHLDDFYSNKAGKNVSEITEKGKQVESATIDDDLTLPSGKTVGHRSRIQYYHQRRLRKSNPDASSAALIEALPTNASDRIIVKTKKDRSNSHQLAMLANSEKGLVGVSESQKRALRATERKLLKLEGRKRNEFQAGVEKFGNKQKHFRNDVPGAKLG